MLGQVCLGRRMPFGDTFHADDPALIAGSSRRRRWTAAARIKVEDPVPDPAESSSGGASGCADRQPHGDALRAGGGRAPGIAFQLVMDAGKRALQLPGGSSDFRSSATPCASCIPVRVARWSNVQPPGPLLRDNAHHGRKTQGEWGGPVGSAPISLSLAPALTYPCHNAKRGNG